MPTCAHWLSEASKVEVLKYYCKCGSSCSTSSIPLRPRTDINISVTVSFSACQTAVPASRRESNAHPCRLIESIGA
ncbi:hypothetical protein VTO42DRAFT_4435 [Malbranchea cinnamomea]